MKSTRQWPIVSPAPSTLDEQLEQVRSAFYSRLRSDRRRLITLCAALTRAGTEPEPHFEDIRMFAHRLRGAAAIFEAVEVGSAAHALEDAVVSALHVHAVGSDPRVWTALGALSDRLAIMNGQHSALTFSAPARRRRAAQKNNS